MIRRTPILARLRADQRGSVTVEMALICTVMLMLSAGTVEAGYAYMQHSSAQTAARHGARLAALTTPVSNQVDRSGGAFDITCAAGTRRCTSGNFRNNVMTRIYSGPDGDGHCAATSRERRGMCDVMTNLNRDVISVRYVGVAGDAGERGRPPLVSVEIAERPLKTVLIGPLLPGRFRTLPAVSATTMGEDLDG